MNLFKKKSKFIEHPDTIKERKRDKRKRWLILLAFVIFMGFFSKYVLIRFYEVSNDFVLLVT